MNELRPLERSLPLSAAQREVWLAETLRPGTAQCNIGEYLEIYGPVDVGLFEAALRQTLAETDALHVAFVDSEDGPRQVLGRPRDRPFPVIDVSAEPEPRAAAEAWMQADMAWPVDLTRDRPFGYALIRTATNHCPWYHRGLGRFAGAARSYVGRRGSGSGTRTEGRPR
jgi:nonribosomal peptide synthetase DhbF